MVVVVVVVRLVSKTKKKKRKKKEKITEGCTFVRVRVEDLSVYADIFLKSHCNVTFEDQNKKKFFIFLKCPRTLEKN